MRVPLLDLRAQYYELHDELDDITRWILESAQFIGGKPVEKFESELADYLGVRHAVSCASGTDALYLALMAAGVRPGDEVITTPYSFFATCEAIVMCGAEPVFVDIDETYNIDCDLIESAITKFTRAILPVHLFGLPANMPRIRAIANVHNLAVIEDACQAIGARGVGVHGDATCYSFFPSKNLGCAGDGGCITTDDDDMAAEMRLLAHHGSAQKYIHDTFGTNSRLDAIQAAILSVKLPHLDRWNGQRQAAAEIYNEAFEGLITPSSPFPGAHVYHLYILRHPEAERIVCELIANGISSAMYYPVALHDQPAFDNYWTPAEKPSLPFVEATAGTTFAIPCFPGITLEQQAYVIEKVKEATA